MTKNIRAIFTVIVLSLTVGAFNSASADLKVAVVSDAKLMKDATAIKTFQTLITKFQADFKAMILKHAKEIDKAASNLLEKKDQYTKEELNKKVKALTARQKEVSKRDQALAKKIEAALLPALTQIKDAIKEAVNKVSQKKGYDIVCQEASLAYFSDSLDITKEVLVELNTSLKKVNVDLPKLK